MFCASRLVPSPKVHRESREQKFFCASRLVPAPKVHRESKEKKKKSRFAPCAYAYGSQGKHGKQFFFRASRFVPLSMVHRESKKNKIFALRASCPRLRFTGKTGKIFFLRFAPRDGIFFFAARPVPESFFFSLPALCSRSPRQILTSNWNGEKNFLLALRASCVCFLRNAR